MIYTHWRIDSTAVKVNAYKIRRLSYQGRRLEITTSSPFLLQVNGRSSGEVVTQVHMCAWIRKHRCSPWVVVSMCICSLVILCRNSLCRLGLPGSWWVLPMMDARLFSTCHIPLLLLQVVSLGYCGGVIWETRFQVELPGTVADVRHLWNLCYW